MSPQSSSQPVISQLPDHADHLAASDFNNPNLKQNCT